MNILTKTNVLKVTAAVLAVFFGWVSLSYAQINIPSVDDLLWTFVNNVFGWLAGAMGVLLNFAIENYIIGFGTQFISGGVGGAVDATWTAVRDIFNLTFIFGLVYIGFKMILNSDDSNTRRWLVNLILAALLVNFSLFITKFIVDFSNILATEIITNGFAKSPSSISAGGAAYDISGTFAQIFGATSIFDGSWINKNPQPGNYMYIFGAAIIFIVMAFVFATGAFMIIIRFVALCLYMVMSPMMFLGWVFPQFSGMTSRYWRGFLGRAFFAPVYALLLYFSAFILDSMPRNPNFANAFTTTGTTGVASTIMPFVIGSVFLLASVVVANRMGADGASAAIRVGQNVQRRAQRGLQRGAVGAGRFGLRNTAGYGAQGVNWASEKAQRGARRLDARLSQTRFGRTTAGNVILTNVAGAADKVTGAGQRLRVAGSETRQEARDRYAARQNVRNATEKEATREQNVNNNLAIASDSRNSKQVRADAITEVNNNVAKLSDERVVRLARENKQAIMDPQLAAAFTDAQVKAISESGILNNDEVKQFNGARNDGAVGEASQFMQTISSVDSSADDLNSALSGLTASIQRFSNERMENYIGNDTSKPVPELVASNLTQKQLDHLKESLSTDRYKQVMDARNSGFDNIANGTLRDSNNQVIAPRVVQDPTKSAAENAAAAQRIADEFAEKRRRELIKNQNMAESMPASVYANANMAGLFSPQNLEKRMEKGGISEEDRVKIENNIQQYISQQEQQGNEKAAKKWVQWTNNSTVGSNFNFTAANPTPAAGGANPNPTPAAPQNPFDRFSTDQAEVQRYFDWEAQNNPGGNNQA